MAERASATRKAGGRAAPADAAMRRPAPARATKAAPAKKTAKSTVTTGASKKAAPTAKPAPKSETSRGCGGKGAEPGRLGIRDCGIWASGSGGQFRQFSTWAGSDQP